MHTRTAGASNVIPSFVKIPFYQNCTISLKKAVQWDNEVARFLRRSVKEKFEIKHLVFLAWRSLDVSGVIMQAVSCPDNHILFELWCRFSFNASWRYSERRKSSKCDMHLKSWGVSCLDNFIIIWALILMQFECFMEVFWKEKERWMHLKS